MIPKQEKRRKRWRIPALIALIGTMALIAGPSSCSDTNRLTTTTRVKFSKFVAENFSRSADHMGVLKPPYNSQGELNYITDFCSDEQKVVCDWMYDLNAPRSFEYTNGTNGHNFSIGGADDNPYKYIDNKVRCVQGKTANGICESHAGLMAPGTKLRRTAAVTVADIGECSGSMDIQEFATILADNFQKGQDFRLGTSRPPDGEDLILWSDYIVNLKPGDWPVEVFMDTTIDENRIVHPEMVIRTSNRVDGNVEWNFDKYWMGGDPQVQDDLAAARGFSRVAQGIAASIVWPFMLMGDCERDRPMTTQIRGELQALPDGSGVGLKPNTANECGPNGDWPCSWVSVLDWPARPRCNRTLKPIIEEAFLWFAYISFASDAAGYMGSYYDPARGALHCLTCTANGGSIIPFMSSLGIPYPIKRVVVTGTDIHFVFAEEPNSELPSNERSIFYNEMKTRGMCGLDRSVGPHMSNVNKGGAHL